MNPLLKMRFFDKHDSVDSLATEFSEGELRAEVCLPHTFELKSIRVFYKTRRHTEEEQQEMRRVQQAVGKALAV